MHDVEAAWARFRNGAGGGLLRAAVSRRGLYLETIGLPRLPAEVVLPGAVGWNLLALAEAEARGEAVGRSLSPEGTVLAHSVATWAAYRESKTLYRVEPALADCLARTPWPDHVPTEALRLPSRCPVLSLPWEGATVHVSAYYDLRTGHEASGELELRLGHLEGDRWCHLSILHLTEPVLGACVRAAGVQIETQGGPPGGEEAFRSSLAGLALTVLLYLGGEPDMVRQIHPGARPDREARVKRRDPERWKDLRAPTLYTVGAAFRAAVERWEIEWAAAAGAPTGRTVRPHMRRAHAHLYWTGPGRGIPRVRFLLPVSVKGGRLVEEAERPTVTPIR